MGGHAFKEVDKIEQENIMPTLRRYEHHILKPILNYNLKDAKILGSALKKVEASGDIDLALDIEHLMKQFSTKNKKHLLELMSEKISLPSRIGYGVSQIWTLFPQHSSYGKLNKNVQIDLVIGNINLLNFTMSSPDYRKSNYNSTMRNEVLSAIASNIIESENKDKDGKIIKRVRLGMNTQTGLMRYTEVMKGIRFSKEHRELVTDNPVEIVYTLFGPSFKPIDVASFESTIKAINSNKFIYQKLKKKIKEKLISNLKDKNIQIPMEVR